MEKLYFIMIETFSSKAKLKRHEKRVMVYAPIFNKDRCSVKTWVEVTLENGFPLDFEPIDADQMKNFGGECGKETTYNSVYEFKLMTCDDVLKMLSDIEAEDNVEECND